MTILSKTRIRRDKSDSCFLFQVCCRPPFHNHTNSRINCGWKPIVQRQDRSSRRRSVTFKCKMDWLLGNGIRVTDLFNLPGRSSNKQQDGFARRLMLLLVIGWLVVRKSRQTSFAYFFRLLTMKNVMAL